MRGRERAERDPAEGQRRQDEEQKLDRRDLHERQHAVELVGEGRRHERGAEEDGRARDPGAAAASGGAAPGTLGEILLRHVERRGSGRSAGSLAS